MLKADLVVADRGVDVALEVPSGETLALLGPNGAGKSTVLGAIVGVLHPDHGRVCLDGRDLTDVPPHRRRIALLEQDPLLFPHLSVLDNVAFGPRSAGVRRAAARTAARRWLREVGVEDLADRRPRRLSGGQAQRAAVARALAAEPDVVLLDEPMAALDVTVATDVRRTLKRVLHGRTAVVVTHDVLDALLLADRVAVLEGGRVVEAGATSEVLRRPRSAFAARVAGLNLVAGTWDDGVRSADGLHVHGVPADRAPVRGEAAVAVFRPSAVSVFRRPPGGSPRNAFLVTVTDMEPHGEWLRVRAGALAADVTLTAAAELGLAPGHEVTFAVKATEVSVYGS